MHVETQLHCFVEMFARAACVAQPGAGDGDRVMQFGTVRKMLELLPIELHRHRRIAAGNRRIALVEQCKRLVAIQLRQLLTNPRGVATAPVTIKRDAQIRQQRRTEEHTSELQSLMRISYAVLCLKKKNHKNTYN